MFSKQPEPGKAQFAMMQTIAKMIGVPPETLAAALYTISTAGERLELVEASLARIELALACGTGGHSIERAGTIADGIGNSRIKGTVAENHDA